MKLHDVRHPIAPPPGHDPSRYDALLRWIAASKQRGRPLSLAGIVLVDQPATSPGVNATNAWGDFPTGRLALSSAQFGERQPVFPNNDGSRPDRGFHEP